MKTLNSIARDSLPPVSEGKIVDMIAVLGGYRKLGAPTLSTELKCMICEGKEHYTPLVDPKIDATRVWICAKGDCVTNSKQNTLKATTTPVTSQRCVQWPLFCEMNGIGDEHHNVKFENIQQSSGKIDYLLKFANKPRGIILMEGDPGSGKTYASMATAEFFTRTNSSCIFTTQKQMLSNWLDTFKSDRVSNYIPKLMECSFLVIDDFGTGDVSPGFMSFFMDLINTRMQWTTRGTIITTNLDSKRFTSFCGEALSDRINTGQQMKFESKTRRTKTIL
jgi:DNA replication protein DnaC